MTEAVKGHPAKPERPVNKDIRPVSAGSSAPAGGPEGAVAGGAGALTGEGQKKPMPESETGNALIRPGERLDDLQCGGLVILQDPERYCFSMDAVLLANYAAAAAGDQVLDLGTGTGIIPLLMSAKTAAAHFDALELQHACADMAARSVRLNGLTERIRIVEGDIREADAILAPASYDVITCNPPYIKAGAGRVNPRDAKAIARHELTCTFADAARAAARLLKPGGHFFLVHRPQRLPELMNELTGRGLEPRRMRMCHPTCESGADMVLMECIRGARPRLTVEKPLIIWKKDGTYTDELRGIYGPD